MLFKGLKVKNLSEQIFIVKDCADIHNIELIIESEEYGDIDIIWCMDKNCVEYDGELIPANLKKLRIEKLNKINEYTHNA
jgi:hypothetical protein